MQLSRAQIPDVFRHDRRSASGDGQLNEVVISLVAEIRPPPIVDVGPAADAQKTVQHGFSLGRIEVASLEQRGSRQERLVLSEEGSSHERLKATLETGAHNLAARPRGTKESRDEDAGVQNDDHEAMIAYTLSSGMGRGLIAGLRPRQGPGSFPQHRVCFSIRSRRPEDPSPRASQDGQVPILLKLTSRTTNLPDGGIRIALSGRRRRGHPARAGRGERP